MMAGPDFAGGAVPTPKRVHFIAIGGTGMGALAGLLKARGVRVTGSDRALYPPMSTALADWGIEVSLGFDPEHVRRSAPDLVVIGNAVRADNPEARAAIDAGVPYRSFSDALYELAIARRHPVVISGTHGKTTTTSLVAYLLRAAGCDPSLLVGGISLDFGGSFREGGGEHFVVEGDEYDTAFFDKTPKFLHYHPRTLVITSIEFDHADIYRDLDHVKSAFRTLVSRMPEEGRLIAAWDDPAVREVAAAATCPVISYAVGADVEADWRLVDFETTGAGTRLSVSAFGAPPTHIHSTLFGRFNAANALAGFAVIQTLGVAWSDVASSLATYRGVRRRQEVRGEVSGVTVIDDFAHHPTAVRVSIEGMRERYPGRRLLAVFEPRSNSSRRGIFQADYARVFDGADVAVLLRVPDEPIYSATGDVTTRLSVDRLVGDLRERGVAAHAFESVEDIVEFLVREQRSGDVVLAMSNGAFGGIWGALLTALRQ